MALVWESYKLDPYVQKLAEAVFNFQEKVQELFLANDTGLSESFEVDSWVVKVSSQSSDIIIKKHHP